MDKRSNRGSLDDDVVVLGRLSRCATYGTREDECNSRVKCSWRIGSSINSSSSSRIG